MDRRWAIAITLFFFLPLAGLGVYSAWSSDHELSESENRRLAQKPPFSFSSLFKGDWTSAFDEYYTDQFPGRDRLMTLSGRVDRWLYVTLKDGSATIGGEIDLGEGQSLDDEWELLPSPTPKPSPSPNPSPSEPPPSAKPSPEPSPPPPEPSPSPTPEPVIDAETDVILITGDRILEIIYASQTYNQRYADMLGRLQDALPDRRVISLVPPNGYAFYAPSSHTQGGRNQQTMLENLYALYDPRIVAVDAYTPIAAHADEYLYFRTDHHWTARGAYRAYTGFCDALGLEPSEINTWENGLYEGFIGYLYSVAKKHPQAAAAAANPDTVEYFIPPIEHTAALYNDTTMQNGRAIPVVNTNVPGSQSNKYLCFITGDQPLIHINTETNNGKSIVVVKESYANAFIPFLLAHYEDIYVIDFRKFNDSTDKPKCKLADFVTEHDIDDVMLLSSPIVPNGKHTVLVELMMP
ncbi:MAG: DHHW family protein [Oscillospiraceae bacterium]|nr:DHHW family protein [Oscillospiraceae bacterium]